MLLWHLPKMVLQLIYAAFVISSTPDDQRARHLAKLQKRSGVFAVVALEG